MVWSLRGPMCTAAQGRFEWQQLAAKRQRTNCDDEANNAIADNMATDDAATDDAAADKAITYETAKVVNTCGVMFNLKQLQINA